MGTEPVLISYDSQPLAAKFTQHPLPYALYGGVRAERTPLYALVRGYELESLLL